MGFEVGGELFELVAGFSVEGAATDFAEFFAEGTLVVVGEGLVAHVEEDVVLFVDVVSQQFDVLVGGGVEALLSLSRVLLVGFDGVDGINGIKGVGHVGGEFSGEGVFVEHDADGSAVAGHASGFQSGKQQVFFFGVVAGVGEGAEEFDTFSIGFDLEVLSGFGSFGEAIEDVDDAQDDLVFGLEDGGGFFVGGRIGHR